MAAARRSLARRSPANSSLVTLLTPSNFAQLIDRTLCVCAPMQERRTTRQPIEARGPLAAGANEATWLEHLEGIVLLGTLSSPLERNHIAQYLDGLIAERPIGVVREGRRRRGIFGKRQPVTRMQTGVATAHHEGQVDPRTCEMFTISDPSVNEKGHYVEDTPLAVVTPFCLLRLGPREVLLIEPQDDQFRQQRRDETDQRAHAPGEEDAGDNPRKDLSAIRELSHAVRTITRLGRHAGTYPDDPVAPCGGVTRHVAEEGVLRRRRRCW